MKTFKQDLLSDEIVAILLNNGVIAYPTDTVYGLGAHYMSEKAVKRICQVKGRPSGKGFPLLLSCVDDVDTVVTEKSEQMLIFAKAFWPGALTLVLNARPEIPEEITGSSKTVAVRVPDHPIPRGLVEKLGAPIVGTSANLSGGPDPVTAIDVKSVLGDKIDCILDGGPTAQAAPSTVLDLTGSTPKVLRIGAIGVTSLQSAIGYSF